MGADQGSMRNPNGPPLDPFGELPADREPSPEMIETAKRDVVEKARTWTAAAEALEAFQAEIHRGRLGYGSEDEADQGEENLIGRLEVAKSALSESLNQLQLLAGTDVMLDLFENLKDLVAAAEGDARDKQAGTPS